MRLETGNLARSQSGQFPNLFFPIIIVVHYRFTDGKITLFGNCSYYEKKKEKCI